VSGDLQRRLDVLRLLRVLYLGAWLVNDANGQALIVA
jgi:hypothetical protein